MNYQTSDEQAATTPASQPQPQQQQSQSQQPDLDCDAAVDPSSNKRVFAVAGSAAKRLKLDQEPTETPIVSVRESARESSVSLSTPSSPSQYKESERTQHPPTAYRRMRSKSLPDISVLSLSPAASDDWAPKERRRHHHHHRSARHHRSHRSKRIDALLQPLAIAVSPANAPPVNVQGLRELDLQEIFKNPQLRHDIVFDPQLQFRPNLDGERGRHKKALADQYWLAVAHECDILVKAYAAAGKRSISIDSSSKLIGIMTSLRDILLSLLPFHDRAQIEQVLDVELQLQQLQHGAFDFVKLAQWLAGIFKSHCAPMRDAWVDQMLSCIVAGAAAADATKLTEGLRLVFTILEAMKLDVANHQIRTLRPLLVETAVEFEQDYFAQRVALRKIDVRQAVEWYKSEYDSSDKKQTHIDAFVSGLVKLFASSTIGKKDEFPVTFALDVSRLRSLKSDIAQISCLLQCLTLYRQLIASCLPGSAPSQNDLESLKAELLILVASSIDDSDEREPGAPTHMRWPASAESIAVQIARRVKDRFPTRGPSLSAVTSLASRWLSANLCNSNAESTVYRLVEQRVLNDLRERVRACFTAATKSASSTENSVSAARDVAPELAILTGRICLLGDFHWSVFAGYYISGVTRE